MSIRENFLKVEKKWAWSFFGFLLALIFGGIAIYTSFLQDKNPNLQFIIEAQTSVLDLKEDIKSLDILYKGINIKEQHKVLSIITLKIKNNSNVTILKEFYDELCPVKILVKDAEIVDKPQVIETSNSYLKQFVNLELDSSGCVFLPKLIIEGQEYFSINLLLLHKSDTEPKIFSSGKIAGQTNDFKVIKDYQTAKEPSFWRKIIFGNAWIHIIRFIFYLLSLIIVTFLFAIPSVYISEAITESRKKKRVKKYINKKGIENKHETDAIFDLYLDHSLEFLIDTQKLITNNLRLKIVLRSIERRDKRAKNIPAEGIHLTEERIAFKTTEVTEDGLIRQHRNNYERVARELLKLEMVKYEDNQATANEIFSKELSDFITYLKLI